MGIPGDRVDIWMVNPGGLAPDVIARLASSMTADERARGERFMFEHGTRDHTVTRGLVRWALSRYASVEPSAWRFDTNEHGRPQIASPAVSDLHFNVSHTNQLVVCAVADRYGVGVDVENVESSPKHIARGSDIARRFFSPLEADTLDALPAERRHERFFHYWTLKEAYIKARGMGLALPLDEFSFRLEPGPIEISFGAGIVDDPQRWQFAISNPTPEHQLAVAIDRGRAADLTVALRRAF